MNTRTTQVFINLGDNDDARLQGFAPFGKVTKGMTVLEKLFSGYGEELTSLQQAIESQGNAYLKSQFPSSTAWSPRRIRLALS